MRLHRVDRYARDVLAGRVLAGPYVRMACERHERDRRDAAKKNSSSTLPPPIAMLHRDGQTPTTAPTVGRCVILQSWRVRRRLALRMRVRGTTLSKAYLEIGQGNGKTPLLAAIGLSGLMADGQRAPEISSAAAVRDQARLAFAAAVRMVDRSPAPSSRIKNRVIEHVHNMTYGLGFFRPFSREQGQKSGTRPHMGLIDEVHEHPTPEACAKIRAGAKGNLDALFPEITNSGFDRTSICWQHHEHPTPIFE